MFPDIHTHTPASHYAILSAYRGEHSAHILDETRYLSAGIHPWYVTTETLDEQVAWVAKQMQRMSAVAVGECGLDLLCDTPFDLQERAFVRMVEMAETLRRPMILHVVKAHEQIMALRKRLSPRQAWIIHGFRGKPELAQVYLRHGFYLSFGKHCHPISLQTTPLHRLFLETDTADIPIAQLYREVARVKNISVEELSKTILHNAEQISLDVANSK